MEEKYCQSCGMPMGTGNELYGTEKDGSKSADYCSYCYENGAFKQECTMDEMIEACVPNMVNENTNMSAETARDMMHNYFPTLKRWKLV